MNHGHSITAAALLAVLIASPALAQQKGRSAGSETALDPRAPGVGPYTTRLRSTLLTLVQSLVDGGVLTYDKGRQMLVEAAIDPSGLKAATSTSAPAVPKPPVAASAPSDAPATAAVAASAPEKALPPGAVRVPYVPESVKAEMREEIRQEVLATAKAERWGVPEALPSWLSRVSFGGDVRLRYQRDDFGGDNADPAALDFFYQGLSSSGQPTTRNSTEDRQRLRGRARLTVDAKVNDDLQANLRIVTNRGGDDNDPTSTNVDGGTFNRRYGLALDVASLAWNLGPYGVRAGRFVNPYMTTDLIWSNDMTLDGLAGSWRPMLSPQWTAFGTVGIHPLREVNNSKLNSSPDSWLLAAQGGVEWKTGTGWQARGGLGLFDFKSLEGRLNPPGAADGTTTTYNETAPLVRQRGNTMFNIATQSNPAGGPVYGVASKFRVVDLNGSVEYVTPEQWRFGAGFDVLENIGWDRDEIAGRIGPAAAGLPADANCAGGASRLDCKRTRGYRLELGLGRGAAELAGSWSAYAGMRHLQRDAVPDGFASGDYRLGGTDVKASFLGGAYTIFPNTQLGLRYISGKSIDLPVEFRVNTWMVDLNAKF